MHLTPTLSASAVSSPLTLTPLHRLHTRLPGLEGDTLLPLRLLTVVGLDAAPQSKSGSAWQVLDRAGRPRGYAVLPRVATLSEQLAQATRVLQGARIAGDYGLVFGDHLLTRLPASTHYLSGADLAETEFLNRALEVPADGPCPSPFQLRPVGGGGAALLAWRPAGLLIFPSAVEWFPDLDEEPTAD